MTKVLVLGSSGAAFSEADVALSLSGFDRVYAVNEMGVHWPGRLDAWVTIHTEKFYSWQARRLKLGYNDDYLAVTHLHADRSLPARVDTYHDHRFPGMVASGSSGLFAVKVALDLGATHVVLAGMPMTVEHGHFYDVLPWGDALAFRDAWQVSLPYLKDTVRSISGWTKELLGEPTKVWLGQNEPDADADGGNGSDDPT